MIGAITAPIISMIMLFVFDYRFGIACLFPIIVLFIIQGFAYSSKTAREEMKKYQDSIEDMTNSSVEYVRGIQVVKIFNQTVYSFKKFCDSITTYAKWALSYTTKFKYVMVIFMVLLHGIYLFIIPAGIFLYGGVESYSSFVLSTIFYLIFSLSLSTPFLRVMYISSRGVRISDAIERMDKYLDVEPLLETTDPQTTDNFDIRFEDVHFS